MAWGVTFEGSKVLLGLGLGSRESYEAWLSFGRDLVERGLNAPALVSPTAPLDSGKRLASCGPLPTSSAARCTRSET